MKILSLIQVTIQFSCIILLALMYKQMHLAGLIFIIAGSALGFVAIWQMRKSRLSILPEITKGATLINSGLYSVIRHPMYLAVILASLGLAINSNSYLSIVILFILVIDLFFKSNREEKLLEKEFIEYAIYKKKTNKIIPGVY